MRKCSKINHWSLSCRSGGSKLFSRLPLLFFASWPFPPFTFRVFHCLREIYFGKKDGVLWHLVCFVFEGKRRRVGIRFCQKEKKTPQNICLWTLFSRKQQTSNFLRIVLCWKDGFGLYKILCKLFQALGYWKRFLFAGSYWSWRSSPVYSVWF